jgi:hypothetical protein
LIGCRWAMRRRCSPLIPPYPRRHNDLQQAARAHHPCGQGPARRLPEELLARARGGSVWDQRDCERKGLAKGTERRRLDSEQDCRSVFFRVCWKGVLRQFLYLLLTQNGIPRLLEFLLELTQSIFQYLNNTISMRLVWSEELVSLIVRCNARSQHNLPN